MVIDPYKKTCKYEVCKQEFQAKRTNQEFCSNEHYIRHNNAKAKSIRDSTKYEERILHRNREILKALEKKSKATKTELNDMGFQFGHFTTILKGHNGETIYACYEYLLQSIDNNIVKIFKNE